MLKSLCGGREILEANAGAERRGTALSTLGRGVVAMDKRLLSPHLMSFLFLLPFLAMLAVHRFLNLSHALMGAPGPGEQDAQLYNFAMVLAFYCGAFAFVISVFLLVGEKHGFRWLMFKLLFLAAFWAAILQFE